MSFLKFSCIDDAPIAQKYEDFKVYDSIFQSVEIGEQQFLINCLDKIICMGMDGIIQWELDGLDLYRTKENEDFLIAQFMYDVQSNSYYVTGSTRNSSDNYIKMNLININSNSEIQWSNEILITDKYEEKDPRANEEFYLQENNYPITAIDKDYLYSAFSYDEEIGKRVRFMLLKISKNGELIDKISYDTGDFYGRVYDILYNSNSEIVLSRGGRDWFTLEIFNQDLNLIMNKRVDTITDLNGNNYSNVRDPILNNIIEMKSGNLILTGHVDILDNINTNFFTNFNYLVVMWNKNSLTFSVEGLNEYKELSFNSFLSDDGSIKLIGVKRGLNELIQDVDSDLLIINVSENGKITDQKIVTENQGFEGIFSTELSTGKFIVIGNKTGFTNRAFNGFYLSFDP